MGREQTAISAENYADWVAQRSTLEADAAFQRHRSKLRLDGAEISSRVFPLLGKAPVLGRGFGNEDDRRGGPAAVALISPRLRRERFDPAVLRR